MGLTNNGRYSEVEVIEQDRETHTHERTTHIVDVFREIVVPNEVNRGTRAVDVVQPGGTVVNVGAGPDLPENPYEGQIWIRT